MGWRVRQSQGLFTLISVLSGGEWPAGQSTSQPVNSLIASESVNEFVCLFDTYNASWGSLSGKESPSSHALASVWVLRWVRT